MASGGTSAIMHRNGASLTLTDLDISAISVLDRRQWIEHRMDKNLRMYRFHEPPNSRSCIIRWDTRRATSLSRIESLYGYQGPFYLWPIKGSDYCFYGTVTNRQEWPRRFKAGAKIGRWVFSTNCTGKWIEHTNPVAWSGTNDIGTDPYPNPYDITSVKIYNPDVDESIYFDAQELWLNIPGAGFEESEVSTTQDSQDIDLVIRGERYTDFNLPIQFKYATTTLKVEELISDAWMTELEIYPAYDEFPDLSYYGVILPEVQRHFSLGERMPGDKCTLQFRGTRGEEISNKNVTIIITSGNDFEGDDAESIEYEDVIPVDGAGGGDDEDGYLDVGPQVANTVTQWGAVDASGWGHATDRAIALAVYNEGQTDEELWGIFAGRSGNLDPSWIQMCKWDSTTESWDTETFSDVDDMGGGRYSRNSVRTSIWATHPDDGIYVIGNRSGGGNNGAILLRYNGTSWSALVNDSATLNFHGVTYWSAQDCIIITGVDSSTGTKPAVWKIDSDGTTLTQIYIGSSTVHGDTGCYGCAEYINYLYVGEINGASSGKIYKFTDTSTYSSVHTVSSANLYSLRAAAAGQSEVAFLGRDGIVSSNGSSWTEYTSIGTARKWGGIAPQGNLPYWVVFERGAAGTVAYVSPIASDWGSLLNGSRYDNPTDGGVNFDMWQHAPGQYIAGLGYVWGGIDTADTPDQATFYLFAGTAGNGLWTAYYDGGYTVDWHTVVSNATLYGANADIELSLKVGTTLAELDDEESRWYAVSDFQSATVEMRGRYLGVRLNPHDCTPESRLDDVTISGQIVP